MQNRKWLNASTTVHAISISNIVSDTVTTELSSQCTPTKTQKMRESISIEGKIDIGKC